MESGIPSVGYYLGFGGQIGPTLILCSAGSVRFTLNMSFKLSEPLFSSLESGDDTSFLGGLVCESGLVRGRCQQVRCCAFCWRGPPPPSPAHPYPTSPFLFCKALGIFSILDD